MYEFLIELALVPYIFIRVSFNILTLSKPLDGIYLFVIWTIGGPIFLIYTVFEDIYYFFKVLCDYKTENDIFELKVDEDNK